MLVVLKRRIRLAAVVHNQGSRLAFHQLDLLRHHTDCNTGLKDTKSKVYKTKLTASIQTLTVVVLPVLLPILIIIAIRPHLSLSPWVSRRSSIRTRISARSCSSSYSWGFSGVWLEHFHVTLKCLLKLKVISKEFHSTIFLTYLSPNKCFVCSMALLAPVSSLKTTKTKFRRRLVVLSTGNSTSST